MVVQKQSLLDMKQFVDLQLNYVFCREELVFWKVICTNDKRNMFLTVNEESWDGEKLDERIQKQQRDYE